MDRRAVGKDLLVNRDGVRLRPDEMDRECIERAAREPSLRVGRGSDRRLVLNGAVRCTSVSRRPAAVSRPPMPSACSGLA